MAGRSAGLHFERLSQLGGAACWRTQLFRCLQVAGWGGPVVGLLSQSTQDRPRGKVLEPQDPVQQRAPRVPCCLSTGCLRALVGR